MVASIAEAIQATREQMHPQLSPSTKGMHTYGHAMTNLGYATEGPWRTAPVSRGEVVYPWCARRIDAEKRREEALKYAELGIALAFLLFALLSRFF